MRNYITLEMTPDQINLEYIVARYKAMLQLEKQAIDDLNRILAEKFTLSNEYFSITKHDLGLDCSQGLV